MSKFVKKTFFLETYGCAANMADSARILSQMQSKNWTQVNEPEKAELSIINSCGVKNRTEITVLRSIKEISDNHPSTLVVTGCLPAMSFKEIVKSAPNFGAIFDTKSTHLFGDILNKLDSGETGITLFSSKSESENKIDILPVLNTPVVGILTINEGCDGNCTFCGTKLARGSTVPFSPKKLFQQIEQFLKNGAKIIWLTSQDTGAYFWKSKEKYWELPELLKGICELPYKFRLRVGMINPDHALRLGDRLIGIFKKYPQIYQFLHIPVQSGNDRVLELMKRRYTVQEFEIIIKNFRKNLPEITIATDVITGFPTESEEDFLDTLNLIRRVNPDILNISKFALRPGTVAAKMKNLIQERVSKGRSRLITTNWQKQVTEYNKKWLGWEGNVIIEEDGRRLADNGNITYIARNQSYRPIVIQETEFSRNPLGNIYKIRITKSYTHYFEGTVINIINSPLVVQNRI